MAQLSAFADEVSESFLTQVQFLNEQNIKFIEPRFINKQNIMQLDKNALQQAKQILDDHGIGVSAIGSPIGKVKIDEDFSAHLDLFKHAAYLADFFETPFIRVFSYYPPEGKQIADYRDEVISRMQQKCSLLENTKITMVHENEANIYGHTAQNCVDMAEAVSNNHFKLAFDSANFVWGEQITDNITSCWPIMKPHVVHIHIKDWVIGAKVGSIPGQGDGQIKELLTELAAMDYKGWMTMEPHLEIGGQFGGSTTTQQFAQAIEAVRTLAKEVNLTCD